MFDMKEDTRVHKYDPMVGHLIAAHRGWMCNPYLSSVVGFDDLWDLAADKLMREKFELIAKATMVELWSEIAMEGAPYGGSPGGLPYFEGNYPVGQLDEEGHYITGETTEWWITVGVSETFYESAEVYESATEEERSQTQWYVDLKKGDGDVFAFRYFTWDEVTPQVLAGWVRHCMWLARKEGNYKS